MSLPPTMIVTPSNSSFRVLQKFAYALAFFLTITTLNLSAQERNLYFGTAIAVSDVEAAIKKTIDNTDPDALVPELRKGQKFTDRDNSNTTGFGLGLLVGYRIPISYNETFLSIEVDLAVDLSDNEGQFTGVGTSTGRNQVGESWPDSWGINGDRNHGVALKISHKPEFLRVVDMTFYVLAGVREYRGELLYRYLGCLSIEPCSDADDTPDFETGSYERDIQVDGWMAGLGLGRELAGKTVIRIEARYTQYEESQWEDYFEDLKIRVPAGLDTQNLGVGLTLTRYF